MTNQIKVKFLVIGLLAAILAYPACSDKTPAKPIILEETDYEQQDYPAFKKLSEYGFFVGAMKELYPAKELIPYEINAPLFSDYAEKSRFIVLPGKASMLYHATDVFDFPEGSILIKNFFYPLDYSNLLGERRLIETRLLIRKAGDWEALTYVWNEDQTDAELLIAGKTLDVSWTDEKGTAQKVNYSVPSLNQCKSCHWRNDKMTLIGLTARQLDKKNESYLKGKNQLTYYTSRKLLSGMPDDPTHQILADYADTARYDLNARARAYLEINCAHCHRPEGPAKNSALNLLASEHNMASIGVGKTPVAAGKGSGGRKYDIVPGHPDESILVYRMESEEPEIMMPELGRRIKHKEGIQLIRDWISNMEY